MFYDVTKIYKKTNLRNRPNLASRKIMILFLNCLNYLSYKCKLDEIGILSFSCNNNDASIVIKVKCENNLNVLTIML